MMRRFSWHTPNIKRREAVVGLLKAACLQLVSQIIFFATLHRTGVDVHLPLSSAASAGPWITPINILSCRFVSLVSGILNPFLPR